MKNLLRISFLFIIIGIFNISFIPVCKELRKEFSREIREKIFKNNYNNKDLIYFSDEDLYSATWKTSEEFVLNGKSYDVIKIQNEKGSKKYYCLHDDKESLLNSVEKMARSKDLDQPHNQYVSYTDHHYISFLKVISFIQIIYFPNSNHGFSLLKVKIPFSITFYQDRYVDRIFTPPRVGSV